MSCRKFLEGKRCLETKVDYRLKLWDRHWQAQAEAETWENQHQYCPAETTFIGLQSQQALITLQALNILKRKCLQSGRMPAQEMGKWRWSKDVWETAWSERAERGQRGASSHGGRNGLSLVVVVFWVKCIGVTIPPLPGQRQMKHEDSFHAKMY